MNEKENFGKWYGTTIVSVRKKNEVVIAGDGQVTLGDAVMKSNAKKEDHLHQEKLSQVLQVQLLMHLRYLND